MMIGTEIEFCDKNTQWMYKISISEASISEASGSVIDLGLCPRLITLP